MKVLVNGGLNLSELDGWWAEAYSPEVGWALGDGKEHDDDPAWDTEEANALYNILENKLIPEFYDRDEKGIPKAWIARIRESVATLTPRFSANRTVQEYTEKHYLPAALSYLDRTSGKGAAGKKLVDWENSLKQKWDEMHFGDVNIETQEQHHKFKVEIHLNGINPNSVRVELYADSINGGSPIKQEMKLINKSKADAEYYIFEAKVSSNRPAADYTPRVIPFFDKAEVPLEAVQILWQK
jgi:starch phosphorylase